MANNFQNLYPTQPAQNIPAMQPNSSQFQPIQIFPQPIGSVYNLNTIQDCNSLPIGQNVSVGICLNEGIICIKSMQNGTPATLMYHLTSDTPVQSEEFTKIYTTLDEFKTQIEKMGKQINALSTDKGGKIEWAI